MEISHYETKDWIAAALLMTLKLNFIGVRREAGVSFFQFKDQRSAEELIESFWRGDLRINARDFVDSQKRIKDLIHR